VSYSGSLKLRSVISVKCPIMLRLRQQRAQFRSLFAKSPRRLPLHTSSPFSVQYVADGDPGEAVLDFPCYRRARRHGWPHARCLSGASQRPLSCPDSRRLQPRLLTYAGQRAQFDRITADAEHDWYRRGRCLRRRCRETAECGIGSNRRKRRRERTASIKAA